MYFGRKNPLCLWRGNAGAMEKVDPLETPKVAKEVNAFSLSKDGLQVFPAIVISCIGFVGSGYVLDVTQHWTVFLDIDEFFIVVPMLLGLKGNLDMCLASRLATASHLGYLEDGAHCRKIVVSSLALIQVQAIVATLVTAIIATVFNTIKNQTMDIVKTLIFFSSVLISMSLAALVLGLLTCLIVILSSKLKINPDNIATPIVSSLGDFLSILFVAFFSTNIRKLELESGDASGTGVLSTAIIITHLLLLPVCWKIASFEDLCAPILKSGWPPILAALGISQFAGIILQDNVQKYEGIAVLVPFINGVGGALGSVFASRLCSSLHSNKVEQTRKIFTILCVGNLILQWSFLVIIHFNNLGHVDLEWSIVGLYSISSTVQVILVLFLSSWLVHYLHARKIDPDNYAIPILTAFGDVFGTALLVLSFFIALA